MIAVLIAVAAIVFASIVVIVIEVLESDTHNDWF